jgi:hypothetical protein
LLGWDGPWFRWLQLSWAPVSSEPLTFEESRVSVWSEKSVSLFAPLSISCKMTGSLLVRDWSAESDHITSNKIVIVSGNSFMGNGWTYVRQWYKEWKVLPVKSPNKGEHWIYFRKWLWVKDDAGQFIDLECVSELKANLFRAEYH